MLLLLPLLLLLLFYAIISELLKVWSRRRRRGRRRQTRTKRLRNSSRPRTTRSERTRTTCSAAREPAAPLVAPRGVSAHPRPTFFRLFGVANVHAYVACMYVSVWSFRSWFWFSIRLSAPNGSGRDRSSQICSPVSRCHTRVQFLLSLSTPVCTNHRERNRSDPIAPFDCEW